MTLCNALVPKDFPNGAVLFCSNDISEVMQPATPLRDRMLNCDTHFDTTMILEALEIRRKFTYGVVVIDGDEATLGTLQLLPTSTQQSTKVNKIAHMSANIASRTRRGGQSATRYSRNRDGEEVAFLRKVVERMNEVFGEVCGIVVGGRAEMKRKLVSELPNLMRMSLVSVVDLQCHADQDGLQQMASHAQQAAVLDKDRENEAALQHFMELKAKTESHEAPLVCYGDAQTVVALKMGAVEELLIAAALDGTGIKKNMWSELAMTFGAKLIEIHPRSESRAEFCNGFGVGACLRYPVDPALLEENAVLEEQSSTNITKACTPTEIDADSDCESHSTVASTTNSLLYNWLVQALSRSLQDKAAGESLAMGAELVIFDDTLGVEERLEVATEMLRGEGVSEEVLSEFACHVFDHFDVDPC